MVTEMHVSHASVYRFAVGLWLGCYAAARLPWQVHLDDSRLARQIGDF